MPADPVPSGRRVIVTGAGGGIGRAIVEALVAGGARVAACDAPGVPIGERAPAATAAFSFDVRDRADVGRGVEGAIEALGGCDAVVAGAGVVDTIHRAEKFSDEDWRGDVEANLYGAFYVVQAAFRALADSGDGRIVLISSVAAEIGLPGQVAYGASKAGLVGLARTLAAEWAPAGIRCNVVMPGMIATPKVVAMPENLQAALRTTIPLRRFGTPGELAGVVSFLLSETAAYLTGSVVRVDGGFGLASSALTG